MIDLNKRKVVFEYPCSWSYVLIGESELAIQKSIQEIVFDKPCVVKYSHKSKNGKYHSYKLELIVHNEEERITLFESFKKHHAIAMVL